MQASERGIQLITDAEGLILHAYLCPAGKWTIGYGHTGAEVKPGMTCTRLQADAMLRMDVDRFSKDVTKLIGSAPTTQNQFDAMVSFAFNLGSDIDLDNLAEGLGDSTLLRKHLAGDYRGAELEFAKWNKARVGGALRPLGGLTRRRAAEAALYAMAT